MQRHGLAPAPGRCLATCYFPNPPHQKWKRIILFRCWPEALEESRLPWSAGMRDGEGRVLLPFWVGAGLLGEWIGTMSRRETHSTWRATRKVSLFCRQT